MENTSLIIRPCSINDKEAWIELNREFMAYEIQDADFWNNTASNSYDRFSLTFDEALNHQEWITLLILEQEHQIMGFANLMTIYSVWSHGKALILDDLYIKQEARGKGIGRVMMEYIETLGKEKGYKRLQFQSEDSNPDAHRFYTKLGYASEAMKFYVKYL
ncbi:GNAT family N-acetyltransferase [Aminipila sp.]|uniref:GNAT family N-acetyltransferase n=1 Tax=Aminipila sp. TaxID=2060095 RepID=UPI002896D868|nr:GNAT family N-acetyltransferase [Aminipila sp.]